MEKIKYTPGPWAIYPDSPDTSVYCDDELGSRVADCDTGLPTILPMAQRKANAKLIAAAPDMLNLLQKLHTNFFIDGIDPDTLPEILESIQEVINKATK